MIDAFRSILYMFKREVFDRDGNGVITAEELKLVMASLGESLSDHEIEKMIEVASNNKSFVTLEDFVTIYLVLDVDISKEMNFCILSDIQIQYSCYLKI